MQNRLLTHRGSLVVPLAADWNGDDPVRYWPVDDPAADLVGGASL
jgi:hypothetical protein